MFHGLLWDVFGDFVLLAPKLCSLCIFARCIQRAATFPMLQILLFVRNGSLRRVYSFAARVYPSAELYFWHLLFGLVLCFFLSGFLPASLYCVT